MNKMRLHQRLIIFNIHHPLQLIILWLFVITHSFKTNRVIGLSPNQTIDETPMIQKMRQKAMFHLRPPSQKSRMSFANCTCHFFTQPLDHFAIGASSGAHTTKQYNMTLNQRYCIYDGYENNSNHTDVNPIFFYTGNESPVETYANHTGLMWTLAPKYNALIVFAEHRYEGLSLPTILNQYNDHHLTDDPSISNSISNSNSNSNSMEDFQDCLSYVASSQALADYSKLLSFLNPNNVRPVIVFGGSYGKLYVTFYLIH